ncbi:MAG: dihydroneopterin aldolase [Bacteroidales bacterium]|jgi:7,8-dihydroneopterin aldolase/epimerase/oxygenase|nr:dihydroneopterin aldolase [Bacteroidales bacterium]MDD2205314.1 dihydroneopterin aldolase [Bacteroidales bacterium]MDD3151748.1 dihydroneopterin aldolase [Bacteroidales bacterium]MDD3914203.1 dihydroneopterin aldolase [Bacteroidales bacterium]MDD4634626.1 dihydroneopterin aldolase [Bacteroidales bacterium]
MSNCTITLAQIQLWGYHGCLPEERIIGAKYTIEYCFTFNASKPCRTDYLYDTINYAEIYNVIKQEFDTPVNLLEHLAAKILKAVHSNFPKIINSTITIKKHNPPISGETDFVAVTMSYK